MKTPPPLDASELFEQLEMEIEKEESFSSPETKRFREYFDLTVEKTEEREEKRPSVFDISADCLKPTSPAPFHSIQVQSSEPVRSAPVQEISSQKATAITPLSKVQCEWILTESTSSITHCIQEGVKETSLRLEGPAFQSSPFQGMELVIKEFSTAPLVFNVEFRGSPSAISVLKPNLPNLCAAFHGMNKPEGYAIHRIDTSIETSSEDASSFLFHRKSPAEEGEGSNL